jgi:hypothetical protein
VIVDRRTIPINPDAGTAVVDLMVGLYLPADGVRLPVYVAGNRQASDQLRLTSVHLSR